MSAINGDKARFNRARKQRIAQRKRNRELNKSLLQEQQNKAALGPKAAA
jgi:hypothetical protein